MAVQVKTLLFLLVIGVVTGCAVRQTPPIQRIALLAPFEGRYREAGYQALYAARMAIAETGRIDLELLAVDDGGTVETAAARAQALSEDPLVKVVLVLGPAAADSATRAAFASDLPVIEVGNWEPVMLPDGETTTDLSAIAELETDFICRELCTLPAYHQLAPNLSRVRIQSSAPPVDAAFRERYVQSDQFVPEPLPMARLTYDITVYMVAHLAEPAALQAADFPWQAQHYTYIYTDTGNLQSQDTPAS